MSVSLRWIKFESIMIAILPVYGRGASIYKIQAAKDPISDQGIFVQ